MHIYTYIYGYKRRYNCVVFPKPPLCLPLRRKSNFCLSRPRKTDHPAAGHCSGLRICWEARSFSLCSAMFFPYLLLYWECHLIPIDFHIFQRGWNHQPDTCLQNDKSAVYNHLVLSTLGLYCTLKNHGWLVLLLIDIQWFINLRITIFHNYLQTN